MPVSLSPKESKRFNSFWSEHYWSWSKYNWLLTPPPRKKKELEYKMNFVEQKVVTSKESSGLVCLKTTVLRTWQLWNKWPTLISKSQLCKGSRSFNLSCFALLLHQISPVNFLVQSSTKGPTPSSSNAIEWDPQLPGTFIPVTLSSCRNILRNEAHRREIKEATKRWLSSHIFTVKNLNNCWF